MSGFQPSDEDVVSMHMSYSVLIKAQTFKISEYVETLKYNSLASFKMPGEWFEQGVPCNYLKASGGGWQKGKLRLRLEFVPDEPAVAEPPEGHEHLLP